MTERVQHRLGYALWLQEKEGLKWRVIKLVEVGGEGKQRYNVDVGDDDAVPFPSPYFLV